MLCSMAPLPNSSDGKHRATSLCICCTIQSHSSIWELLAYWYRKIGPNSWPLPSPVGKNLRTTAVSTQVILNNFSFCNINSLFCFSLIPEQTCCFSSAWLLQFLSYQNLSKCVRSTAALRQRQMMVSRKPCDSELSLYMECCFRSTVSFRVSAGLTDPLFIHLQKISSDSHPTVLLLPNQISSIFPHQSHGGGDALLPPGPITHDIVSYRARGWCRWTGKSQHSYVYLFN